MCLSTLTPFRITVNKTRKGYKVIREYGRGWDAPIYNGKNHDYNVWIEDSNSNSYSTDYIPSQRYTSGFHICTTKEDAEAFIRLITQWGYPTWGLRIVEVRYKDVVAKGLQEGIKVVVARKIFVKNE